MATVAAGRRSVDLFITVVTLLIWLPVSHQSLQEDVPNVSPTSCTNCPPDGAMDIQIKLLPSAESGEDDNDAEKQRYSSEDDDSVMKGPDVKVSLPEDNDHWKTKVIIGCTITAAVEIVIVIFIIAYWKEIRWTLRKLSCPCDERGRGNHEAMERDRNDVTQEVVEVHNVDQEVQTYAIPQTSRQGARSEEEEERVMAEQSLETSSV